MDEKDIAEQAYKNGYEQGVNALAQEIKGNVSVCYVLGTKMYTITADAVERVIKDVLKEQKICRE